MGIGNKIRKVIAKYAPISLDQMDGVKLMRRMDTKYVFRLDQLPALLKQAKNNYFMVEIEEEREQIYKTTYYDTENYDMYHAHHNGNMNRHKIRVRKYVYTHQKFIEVKRKNNKGETIKNRIAHPDKVHVLNAENSETFLNKYSPFKTHALVPKLDNKFVRLTLVNKDFSERITLDYKLKFTDLKYQLKTEIKDVCICEIKKGRDNKNSPFIGYLRDLRIQSMGFSKYSLGIALLNPDVKTNNFKRRIRAIIKI
ncbi:MAG: polyphosphate polymerase domain-containing protein [Prolixibacteraceae bacterium]